MRVTVCSDDEVCLNDLAGRDRYRRSILVDNDGATAKSDDDACFDGSVVENFLVGFAGDGHAPIRGIS